MVGLTRGEDVLSEKKSKKHRHRSKDKKSGQKKRNRTKSNNLGESSGGHKSSKSRSK